MAQQTIDIIRQAEMDFANLRQQAIAQAEQIISLANTKADKIIYDAVKTASIMSEKQLFDARNKADETIASAKHKSEQKAQQLYLDAVKNQDRVNDLVKSLIV